MVFKEFPLKWRHFLTGAYLIALKPSVAARKFFCESAAAPAGVTHPWPRGAHMPQPPPCLCPGPWQMPWSILRTVWKWCAIASLNATLAACLELSKLQPCETQLDSFATIFILGQPLFKTQTNQRRSRSYDNVAMLCLQHVQLSSSTLSLRNLSPSGSGSTFNVSIQEVSLHDVGLPLCGRSRNVWGLLSSLLQYLFFFFSHFIISRLPHTIKRR